MLTITILAGRESFFHDICLFYRASLGGPDERREQKFATLVGDHFGMSPTNILLTQCRVSQDFVENIFSVHYGRCQSLVSEPFSGIDIVSAFGLSSLILK
ncbi:hypothetical protein AA904_09420 [Geobacillus stearothermophilus]|uniref:Uncharacterized protein n=1 Tax=Geobacillus stearothermophilus TaxID=1422 RepID=A0A3L7D9T7_GEOSE|nr:hypothetical protein AA904_09420 [Geobacillus stearothermophilus]RLQ13269.1 hypothetical protein D9548_12535 [Geobacillus stearothermophilus]